MFDPAFSYYQVVNKYLVGIKEQNPSSGLAFGDGLSSEQEFLCSSPAWGDKHNLTWCHTETPQAAPMAVGSGSLPAAFPHHQCQRCHAGLCDFYTGHCAVLFHRHVFDHPKN